jgi:hypothetical protein
MMLDGREIRGRPDVATTYGRADLLSCGWRGMLHLPLLPHGDYNLVPEADDGEGNSGILPASILTISD